MSARAAVALLAVAACSSGSGPRVRASQDAREVPVEAGASPAPSPAPAATDTRAASDPADARATPVAPEARDAGVDGPAGMVPGKAADAASARGTPDVQQFFVDGGAPFKCAPGMRYPASCEIYCACWFQLCAPMPRFACVFPNAARCMDECSQYKDLAYAVYRVNNQPLGVHCGDSLPAKLQPGQDAGPPCPTP